MFSQNAMNNLKNKYSAVLKKCHFLNTFGSLAVAGMLCVGTVVAPCGLVIQNAWAADITGNAYEVSTQTDSGQINVNDNLTITSTVEGGTYTAASGSSITGALTLGGGPVTLAIDGDLTIGAPGDDHQYPNVTFANWSYSTLQIKSGTTTAHGMTDIDNTGTLIVKSGATYIAEGETNIGTSFDPKGHLTIENGATYIAKEKIGIETGTLTNEGTLIGTDLSFGSGSVDVRYGNMVLSGKLDMFRNETFDNGIIAANTFQTKTENTDNVTPYYLTNNTILAVENITGSGKIFINGTTDEKDKATTGGSLLVVGAPNYVTPDSTDITGNIDPAEVLASASARYQWVYDSINEANKNLASDAQLDPTSLGTLAVGKAYGTTYETYDTEWEDDKEIIVETYIHHKGLLSVGNYTPSNTDSDATAIGFGSDSLLVVHAGALGDDYALTATEEQSELGTSPSSGDIEVLSGAKLLVSGVSFDKTSSVTANIAKADGYLTIESGAWGYDGEGTEDIAPGSEGDTTIANDIDLADANNLYFDNALINVASYIYDVENNTYSVILTKQSLASELPSVDQSYAGLVDSTTTLAALMNKVLELDNDKEKTDILNGLSKTGAHVGAVNTVSTLANLGADIAGDRSSFVNTTSDKSTIVSAPVLLAESDATFTDASVPMIADAASQNGMVNGFAQWLQPFDHIQHSCGCSFHKDYGI